MTELTNSDLTEQIKELDDKVDTKFDIIKEDFAKFRHEIRKMITPLNNYILTQQGYDAGFEKARQEASIKSDIKSGNTSVTGQLIKLVATALGIITTAVGIIAVLVNANN